VPDRLLGDAELLSDQPPGRPRPDMVVASFNVHGGIDGWGRPFDVVGACAALDADVLVLQETWANDGGAPMARSIASALGYAVVDETLAHGRRALPHPDASPRWMRRFDWRGPSHALYLDSERALAGRVTASPRFQEATPGRWGLAVLTRLPLCDSARIDLGRLPRDRARRVALVARIELRGVRLSVVGTHLSHLTYGSPIQFARLRQALSDLVGDEPAVLAGDMNLWGPPVEALLPGWRRAVRGRTWPAWRPNSQVDHILVRGGLHALSGRVLAACGSDHRPVAADLSLD
jgi:endonuclease/exonuclease/phosphatase family metal-dependent hydrolase